MTIQLFLMRHGEAEHGFGKPDSQRQLTPFGKQEITTSMQQWLQNGFKPHLLLVSPVTRALQTAEIISGFLRDINPGLVVKEAASLHYQSTARHLLDEIKGWNEPSVFAVGHQPLIGDFIQAVCKQDVPVSTASIHSIEIQTDTTFPKGKLTHSVYP